MISRFCLVVMLVTTTGVHAQAQEPWLDTVPALSVVCVRDVGALESLALPSRLRELASKAGDGELGVPFVLQKNAVDGKPAASEWEMCAVRPSGKTVPGLEARTLPASPGAFQICGKSDPNACAESLRRWVVRRVADFDAPMRVVPLIDFAESKREAIRGTVGELVVSTPDKLMVVAQEESKPLTKQVPEPKDLLDRQLFGDDKTPRSLLTVPSALNSQPPAVSGVLVYVPVSEPQKAALADVK